MGASDTVDSLKNVLGDDSVPSDVIFLSGTELTDINLREKGDAYSSKYLIMSEMLRFGRITINTTSLKRRFDGLFTDSSKQWINGLMWATENFARLFDVSLENSEQVRVDLSIARRSKIIKDVRSKIRIGMHPSDEELVDAFIAAAGLDENY